MQDDIWENQSFLQKTAERYRREETIKTTQPNPRKTT